MGVTAIDQGLVAHLNGTLLHGDSLLTHLDTVVNDGDGTGHMAAISDGGCTDDGIHISIHQCRGHSGVKRLIVRASSGCDGAPQAAP